MNTGWRPKTSDNCMHYNYIFGNMYGIILNGNAILVDDVKLLYM